MPRIVSFHAKDMVQFSLLSAKLNPCPWVNRWLACVRSHRGSARSLGESGWTRPGQRPQNGATRVLRWESNGVV